MIRILGFRGLAVGLFAACAAMVPARGASRPDGRNEPPYYRDGQGRGMVIVSRQVRAWAASLPRSKSASTMPPQHHLRHYWGRRRAQ
jgi:hypothetical protein